MDWCFVLMPFKDPFNSYYDEIIKPAVEKTGLKPIRADEIYGIETIMCDIWNTINSAKVLIAELTSRNANVLYELGLAHAIRKPVIIISQSIEDIPFEESDCL